jgi:hypothetical protein
MNIINAKPEWGQTLQPGYCGFITREHDFVGDGIEYFEHFETGLPFVHTFIVEGLGESSSTTSIIEAHAVGGVQRATLNQYLDRGQSTGRCQCFIRIPVGYTEKIGASIVATASAHLGERYAFPLIVADAFANTVLGHYFNKLTFNLPDRLLCRALSNGHQKICSQLVALALQSQFYLHLRGCLRRPADTILPKELGNDPSIFSSITYKIS